ncbi:hypothetical protein D1646_02975 [Pseudoflavonifractor sp. 60]|uniref:hypothetical protein n=1 Tax=Pseudoflavonifractor sp. 60 TaxID=2304576 RepID=UPI00136ACD44|nr:hypothetical protein [Pseudoflavonifractor sp. 60]MCI8869309.1 hypothetical protein [Lawsonibacter sp.]NBI65788.1 hypothetical protein [Pseudoflavonifractor sp. 60]
MAKISVELAAIKPALQKEEELAAQLMELYRDVNGIRSGLRFKIAGQEQISARLLESAEQITKEQNSVRVMREALEQILAQYKSVETRVTELVTDQAEALDVQELAGGAYDQNTTTFDNDKSNGTYGADQGDMANNKKGMWFFGFRWFEDEDLYAYIRQHSRYQNYSQSEIAKLMEQINYEGCGFVAIVNNIFVEYEGREEEFERVFGFPMYDKNGKANYNYLLVDFYANTNDRFYIDEPGGATAMVNEVLRKYADSEDEFKKTFGCPLYDSSGSYHPQARQKILDAYQNTSVVTIESQGTTVGALDHHIQHYLNEKGVSCTSDTFIGVTPLSSDEMNQYMDEGKNVNILITDFNLYQENGKLAQGDVGGHWMTVTGVADDGRYIVSSWGKKYYVDPSELKWMNLLITDITP